MLYISDVDLVQAGWPASLPGEIARHRDDRPLAGVVEHIVQGCSRCRQGLRNFPRAVSQSSANAVGKPQEVPRKQHPGVAASREDARLCCDPGDF